MSIPGIGRAFALLIVSEIDDVGRFTTDKKLHAYVGLVPSTYACGGHTFHGRIVKGGDKYLLWAMVEAIRPVITFRSRSAFKDITGACDFKFLCLCGLLNLEDYRPLVVTWSRIS
jgi:transposase